MTPAPVVAAVLAVACALLLGHVDAHRHPAGKAALVVLLVVLVALVVVLP